MSNSQPALLDRFMLRFDVRGRHEITIHAPAPVVIETARNFRIESVFLVRSLFKMRAAFLRSPVSPPLEGHGLVEQMTRIGWQILAEERDQYLIAGSACRPWLPDPGFTPVGAETFAAFSLPGLVKIAWTLEAIRLGPDRTLFATETRAAATDESARRMFRSYWRKFGAGIVLIRLVLLPALRRQAENNWRLQKYAA